MTNSLLNVFFGTLDSLATLALIYKIFRWPFWRSFNKLIVIAVVIAIVSLINRTVLGLAEFDTAIQFVLYIIFLRYIIRVSADYACSLTAIGYVSFLLIQFTVYPVLLASGIVSMDDAESISNLGTYIIQASTEILCYLIAYALYAFALGFTYIDIPPHDEYGRQRKSKLDMVANILGSISVATLMYWILNYQTHIYIIIPLLVVSLALLLIIARRKEFGE
jgi:hypothetical protein